MLDQSQHINDILKRHSAFWKRGDTSEPLLRLAHYNSGYGQQQSIMRFNLADGSISPDDVFYLEPEMLSPERLSPRYEDSGGKLLMNGDVFQVEAPFARVPWMEAMLGCAIRVSPQGHSMRPEHLFGEDWHTKTGSMEVDQRWIDKLLEFTDYLSSNAKDDKLSFKYLVSNTLMRGPSDMVEALIGGDNLCAGIYEHPDELHRLMAACSDVFIGIAKAQLDHIDRFNSGYCNLFGIWAPGTSIRTQDDASALVSPAHYAEFMLPYQERIASYFEYSTIHLHSGSLHTVDWVLDSSITAVQVSIDPQPYGPTVTELMPVFARMQKKKPILIEGPMLKEEFEELLKTLSPKGLYIWANIESPEDRIKTSRYKVSKPSTIT